MTHVLLWLLLFPVVTSGCTYVYAATTDADLGALSRGYAAVYAGGTALLVLMHYTTPLL